MSYTLSQKVKFLKVFLDKNRRQIAPTTRENWKRFVFNFVRRKIKRDQTKIGSYRNFEKVMIWETIKGNSFHFSHHSGEFLCYKSSLFTFSSHQNKRALVLKKKKKENSMKILREFGEKILQEKFGKRGGFCKKILRLLLCQN